MKPSKIAGWFAVVLLLCGCAAFSARTQFSAGRQALLAHNPEVALVHFQQAAQIDPNYVFDGEAYRAGIWTYVGRAQYATGKLAEARESLEKAAAVNKEDYLARLYLGLTLLRGGDRARGLKEIETGLKGLHDWIEYVHYYSIGGAHWDPVRRIRSEIEQALAMIAGKDIDEEKLIASAEWIGQKVEEELDLARRDEQERRRERDFRRRGLSVGVGLDF